MLEFNIYFMNRFELIYFQTGIKYLVFPNIFLCVLYAQ
jgi:hypothetical protein